MDSAEIRPPMPATAAGPVDGRPEAGDQPCEVTRKDGSVNPAFRRSPLSSWSPYGETILGADYRPNQAVPRFSPRQVGGAAY
jgi:hypothetical protein